MNAATRLILPDLLLCSKNTDRMKKQKKVLLVDDSMTTRAYLKSLLEAESFEIVEAGNGQEALIIIEKALPDAMVLDLLMPEMDGFELLEKLKEKDISFPIVVLTADIQEQVKEECMALGATAVINKPITTQETPKKIISLLS